MKKNAVPFIVLGLVCAGYLIFIAGSASLLPERVGLILVAAARQTVG